MREWLSPGLHLRFRIVTEMSFGETIRTPFTEVVTDYHRFVEKIMDAIDEESAM